LRIVSRASLEFPENGAYIARDMSMVLDTDVLVAAVRSPTGASAELLRRVLLGKCAAMVSVPLFLETEAVLTRSEHLAAAGASKRDICNLLDALAAVTQHVEIRYLWRPQLPDADDDMVLECAINGGVRHLVTFNSKDFQPAASRFGLHVLTPSVMLREKSP
jgi:putative PIN family toxin of toxin-antitoxin system